VDENGNPKAVSNNVLKTILHTLKDNIKIVILNACYSQSQADALKEEIDSIIGMNESIGDEAAILFAAAFYRGIGFGRSIQTSFELGNVALLDLGRKDDEVPQLLHKKGVDLSKEDPFDIKEI
jgi:hypothetical protein